MKIGTISDLHIDRHPHLNPEIYLEKLCQVIKQRSIELLIIAGDISNDYRISYDFIQSIQELSGIPTYFVPGNHDLWSDQADKTSTEILSFFRSKEECLIGNPIIINDRYAIVGHVGWYDYSYADRRFLSKNSKW